MHIRMDEAHFYIPAPPRSGDIKKNPYLDINHRPLKHESLRDMFMLSICVKLYKNQSIMRKPEQ